jgi:hypothetical protein
MVRTLESDTRPGRLRGPASEGGLLAGLDIEERRRETIEHNKLT